MVGTGAWDCWVDGPGAEVAEMLGVGSAVLLLRTIQTTPPISASTTATPISPNSSFFDPPPP
ncbi:MAG: hypothetical protein QM695_09860 [Micropruina sp.]